MKRRILSLALCLGLCLSLLPFSAFAEGTEIKEIEVSGINVDLKADEKPEFTAVLSDASAAQMEIYRESWSDLGQSPPRAISSDYPDSKFVIIAGHPYDYGITFKAKEGYFFSKNTVLKYNGETFPLKEGEHSLSDEIGTGTGKFGSLGVWLFFGYVVPPVDDFKALDLDLTMGGFALTPSQAWALGGALSAAAEVDQVYLDMGSKETKIDLDKDGNYDLLLKTTDVNSQAASLTMEVSTFSLTEDYTLTLTKDALDYAKEKLGEPYAETIRFQFQGEEIPYTLNLSGDPVTISDPDFNALMYTLTSAADNGDIGLNWDGGQYDFDLDKDGQNDIHIDVDDETSGKASLLENASFGDSIDVNLSLTAAVYHRTNGNPYFTTVTVTTKAPEPAKDLGELTIDLSKDATVTLTQPSFGALQATLSGLDPAMAKTEGTVTQIDADKDGKFDLKAEKQPDGSALVSLTEDCSLTADAVLTLTEEGIQTITAPEYYKTVTVKVPEAETLKDLGDLTVDLSKEKTVTVTSAEYDAFRASLTGLEAKETVKSKTEGDVISVDLDKDGKFDIEVNGARAFSLTEDCSLTKDTTITLSEDEIAAIDTARYMEYYKTITVKISGEAPGENPFTDVKEGDYFYDAVLWAFYADPQVTDGMTDTTFGPYLTVTRGQCVTFLWRAMGKPEPTTDKNPFTDVPADQYYYKAVLWAVEKGITDGMTDTTFEPNTTLSTAHIITFLYRTLGIGTNGWYQEAADWAATENLMEGTNLTVDPKVNCPRGAVVTFLYRELGME